MSLVAHRKASALFAMLVGSDSPMLPNIHLSFPSKPSINQKEEPCCDPLARPCGLRIIPSTDLEHSGSYLKGKLGRNKRHRHIALNSLHLPSAPFHPYFHH
jgi:hypothetical protein